MTEMFEGVYDNFDDAPVCGRAFSDKTWVGRERSRMRRLMSLPDTEMNGCNDYPLLLAAAMLNSRKNDLNVIDFGGGAGKGFLSIARGLRRLEKLRYTIIDNYELCSLGKELFLNDARVEFYESLAERSVADGEAIDIFHFGSCLQYVKNWEGLLKETLDYDPKILLFSDILAGEIDSFTTCQLMFGSKVPYRFFNIKNFIKTVENLGYDLILHTDYYAKIKGKYGPLATSHFPLGKRLEHSANLLFRRD